MTENVRRLAARTLAQTGVRRLPVRLGDVAQKLAVPLFTYSDYAGAAGITQDEVIRRFGADGFTQQFGGQAAVFYREGGNPRRTRWTVAHELAHLLLGHLEGAVQGSGHDRDADLLAAELLCPMAVVAACGRCDSACVAALCDVSRTAAQGVCLRWRDTGFSDEEQHLVEKCGSFIAEKQPHRGAPPEETVRLPRLQSRRI